MRVMLVEDDPQLGAALQRALELATFDCVWVRRVKEAWAFLEHSDPGVVVLDLGLPDGDGLSILQALRDGRLRPGLLPSGPMVRDGWRLWSEASADKTILAVVGVSGGGTLGFGHK